MVPPRPPSTSKPHVPPPPPAAAFDLPHQRRNLVPLNSRSRNHNPNAWDNPLPLSGNPVRRNPLPHRIPLAPNPAPLPSNSTVVPPRDPPAAPPARTNTEQSHPPPPAHPNIERPDPPPRAPAYIHIPHGFSHCPTGEELKKELDSCPREVTGAFRETYPPWKCPCGVLNYQMECLLATLPPLECTSCGRQNHVTFKFDITRVKLNSIDLNTPVLDQGTRGVCSLFAARACGNMYQRIESAKRQVCDLQQLEEKSMISQYAKVAKCEYKKEPLGERGEHRSRRMFRAMEAGVSFETNATDGKTMRHNFKPKKIWVAPKANFSQLCQLIANGHPMVSSIIGGKRLSGYKPGTIYKAPSLSKALKKDIGFVSHAIVLSGGGAVPYKSGTKRLFSIRNSYSKEWGHEGDGMIRPKDLIRDPMGMSM